MSRSTRNKITTNPVDYYINWSAEEGYIRVYNRETKETTKRETLKFAVLDNLFAISGYTEEDGQIYSNEIRNISEDVLKVRQGNETIAVGTYSEIREKVKSRGGKFTNVLYVLLEDGKSLGQIKFSGASNGVWISFKNSGAESPYEGNPKPDIYREGIAIVGKSELRKKGVAKWFDPVLETYEVSEEFDEKTLMMDEKVQAYLGTKIEKDQESIDKAGSLYDTEEAAPHKESVSDPVPDLTEADLAEEDDDLPF